MDRDGYDHFCRICNGRFQCSAFCEKREDGSVRHKDHCYYCDSDLEKLGAPAKRFVTILLGRATQAEARLKKLEERLGIET